MGGDGKWKYRPGVSSVHMYSRAGDGPVSLLPCCVPDLSLDSLVIYLYTPIKPKWNVTVAVGDA